MYVFTYLLVHMQAYNAHTLSPGINLRSLGPIFRKEVYPSSLSSSLLELNFDIIDLTAGGIPCFLPARVRTYSPPPTCDHIDSTRLILTEECHALILCSYSCVCYTLSSRRPAKDVAVGLVLYIYIYIYIYTYIHEYIHTHIEHIFTW